MQMFFVFTLQCTSQYGCHFIMKTDDDRFVNHNSIISSLEECKEYFNSFVL